MVDICEVFGEDAGVVQAERSKDSWEVGGLGGDLVTNP